MDYYLISNNTNYVCGIATVRKSFDGPIHSHPHTEYYYLLRGEGILHIDGENKKFCEGEKRIIKANQRHAFISTGTNDAKLFFSFESGPLESIKYTYGYGCMKDSSKSQQKKTPQASK